MPIRSPDVSLPSRPSRPEEPASPLSVAAFGDVENELTGLRDLLHAVENRGGATFGVLLGDVVRRTTPARYRLLVETIDRRPPAYPLHAVPGNRDLGDGGRLFTSHLSPREWTFRSAGHVVLGLDDAEGDFTPASLALAARTAAQSPASAPLLVFAHQPIHVDGADERLARDCRRRRDALRSALRGREIAAFFSAHLDLWQETRDADGTLHVTNGHVRTKDGASTPTAAIARCDARGIRVERVSVPTRFDALDAARFLVRGPIGDRFTSRSRRPAAATAPAGGGPLGDRLCDHLRRETRNIPAAPAALTK